MFRKTKNSWKLVKECWRVLWLDKKLAVFPLLSSTALILVFLSFLMTFWLAGPVDTSSLNPVVAAAGNEISTTELISYFLFYFLCYFIMIYFNAALIACAISRFEGGEPTVLYGIRSANQRITKILAWSALSASIGVILRVAGDRSGPLVRVVTALLGAGWTIASYFAVPVIIMEGHAPVAALKRSASIINRIWGDTLLAEIGMKLLVLAAQVPGFLMIVGGITLLENYPEPGVLLMLLGIAWVISFILVTAALDSILRAAMYLFGINGRIEHNFDNQLMESAFTGTDGTAKLSGSN